MLKKERKQNMPTIKANKNSPAPSMGVFLLG